MTEAGLPRLHVVTDDVVIADDAWIATATAVLAAGAERVALHLRGPRTCGRTLFDAASTLSVRARDRGGRLFVNDRVDVALALAASEPGPGAIGVHLGGRSLPLAETRRLVGTDVLIGVSTHAPDEPRTAGAEGADFAFLGAIFGTPSHPADEALGLAAVRAATALDGAPPVVAIGGIDPSTAPGVLDAGAYGVAAIRGIWGAPDPAAAVERYLDVIARRSST